MPVADQPGRIKTGSWFSSMPVDHIRVGISRGRPRFAGGYKAFPALYPGPWSLNVDTETYCRLYLEILDQLDPRETTNRLIELGGGRVPVLTCFERVGFGQWCHRSLAARWLSEAMGELVPEVGFEHLPQDRHPMLPP